MREGQLDAWATPGAENGQQTAVLLEEGGVGLVWSPLAGGTEELNRRFLPAGELLTHSGRLDLMHPKRFCIL